MKTVVVKRILRHKAPIIIYIYFKNTREEEIVNKVVEEYNKDIFTKVTNINSLSFN